MTALSMERAAGLAQTAGEAATVCGIRVLGRVIYWLAVLVISLALLVALVLFFESQDQSSLDQGAAPAAPLAAAAGHRAGPT